MSFARPCETAGCAGICGPLDRLCPSCKVSRERPSSASRGYGRQWRRRRDRALVQQPFCRAHEAVGLTEQAQVRDHIIPRAWFRDRPDFCQRIAPGVVDDDDRNLWNLCADCHSTKTRLEVDDDPVAAEVAVIRLWQAIRLWQDGSRLARSTIAEVMELGRCDTRSCRPPRRSGSSAPTTRGG